MARPVTLFTGQWADLPLTELAKKASSWGYDGLELACWGDHMDVVRAAADKSYCEQQLEILNKTKELYEIKFVEHESPFYQLGQLYTYELKCELTQLLSISR